ncbi:hypothetical protein M9Y10_015614 [Tritrichomonas musculus]|uniref:Protein kinase domain-containing protein n=1 Tax=Tritrichomonas musculus TaxID=1915356 RepID=A0ABR2L3P8_9EUKA
MSNENEVIDLSQFTVKDKIGGGYFSQVSIIEDKDTKQIYAAKFFTKIPENKTQSDMLYVSREVNFGAGMNHPSIIKFIGYSPKNFENEDKPIIITEYCKNGSLYNFIQEQNKYPELLTDTKKLIIIYGIAAGMKYLHSNNILHRDLKPENILLDDRLLPKIADFGLIKMESMNDLSNYIQSTDGMKGTALYQPREAISYGSQNPKTDVYSFALIVYYIMTSIVPFSDVRDKFTVKLIDGYRPEFKSPINESYKKFIEECWAQEPNDRPSFDDIVKLLKKPEFITEKVNKEDYLSYVKYIEDYQSSFDAKKKIVDLEDYIPEASASFARIDIARYVEEPKKTILSSIRKRLGIEQEKLFPFSEFNKLCDSCKKLVTEAENDPDKQFIIAKNLHDGTSKFPKNIEISVRYLERSTEKGNIDSTIFLSRLLIEGNVVSQDIPRAKKYLNKLIMNNKEAFDLYKQIIILEKNPSESAKYFEIGAEKGYEECEFRYAEILFKNGGPRNIERSLKYLIESKDKGFLPSKLFLNALNYMNDNQSFVQLDSRHQHFIIKKIVEFNKKNTEKDQFSPNKAIDIGYRFTQKYFKSFESSDFINVLNSFESVSIEIQYPSKFYENVFKTISEVKEKYIPRLNLNIFISGVDQISNKFGPNLLINTVRIGSSVQEIFSSVFEKCCSISEITIPSSVTKIGDDAFHDCVLLKQITIPSSVTSIGYNAFCGCKSLVQITLPSSLTDIKENTFRNCTSLVQVTIPSSVNNIGPGSFRKCISLKEILIPSSVKVIENSAFMDCSSLTEITLPSSITKIGDYTFNKCTSLTKISIPSSVTEIGVHAFGKCSSMTEISLPSSMTEIKSISFDGCLSLEQFSMPTSVTKIGNISFDGCSSLTQIPIPTSVKEIGYMSLTMCSNLTRISIPSSVVKIGSLSFVSCSSLAQISLPSSIREIGYISLAICSSLEQLTIPSSVSKIENISLDGCSSLREISIPSSVKEIGELHLIKCSSLVEIIIPSSSKVGSICFHECSSLIEVSLPSSIDIICEHCFDSCSSLKQIEIPSSVTLIGNYAFNKCSSLTKIWIPKSVKEIKDRAFDGCVELKEIIIPLSVTKIGDLCFNGCSLLTKMTIPSSVRKIGNLSFDGCSSLKKIEISKLVTKIGRISFNGCSSLKEISIPKSVKVIHAKSFKGCTSLAQICIPSSIPLDKQDSITRYTLAQNLMSLSVTSIKEYAFSECTSLIQIKLPSSLVEIAEYAFEGCSSLKHVLFASPYYLVSIGKNAFCGCSSLKEISIPSSVDDIGDYAFVKCSSLTKIEILSSTAEIGSGVFDECSSLREISIPSEFQKPINFVSSNVKINII